MAKSGYKDIYATYTTSGAVADTLRFNWWETSQSIEGNYTDIGWSMQLIAGGSGYISSSVSKNWSVNVNGSSYSGTNTVGISSNTTKTLASGTTRIYHNADGTKTFTYSFSQEFKINFNTYVGTKSGSGSGTLDTIPRKSTLTVSDGTLGVEQELKITRNSSAFTHTLTCTCGSWSATICEKTTIESLSYTPPVQFAIESPNDANVLVVFTLETFNGNTSLGSNTYTRTFAIPSSVAPTVSFTVEDAEGYQSTYGAYIQGKSKFKIKVTASGKEGSTISSYKITADGKTYKEAEVETDAINSSGTLTLSVTVTDSRGRTSTATKQVTVLAYSNPKIVAMSVQRSNASGVANSSGAYLCVKFSATVTSLNSKNSAQYKIAYKKKNGSMYGDEYTVSKYTNTYEVVNGTYVFSAYTASSYDVMLIVEDAFDSVDTTRSGSSVYRLFSAFNGGLGWAFGKVAELQDYIELNFKAMFHKIVEFKDSIYIGNNVAIKGRTTTGYVRDMLWMNSANECVYGSGSYLAQEYSSKYCGHDIHLLYNNKLYANGKDLFENRVLWIGSGYYMHETQTINLNEKVSEQRNGIVLVWSGYDPDTDTALDYRWSSFFVPKYIVSQHGGTNHSFTMATSNFAGICSKSVTITDTSIIGGSNNDDYGTNNGVTYDNRAYVLRYVIGV